MDDERDMEAGLAVFDLALADPDFVIMGPGFHAMAGRIASRKVRTAGRIEFIRDQGPLRRDVRAKGFQWDEDVLRNLAKILWAAERAHGYGMSALRLFSKMSSSEFSPDGLLGGRGYIQQVKELRAGLGQAVEVLSSFTDTVHDEINAPHWSSVLESPEVGEIVEDARHVKADPEGFVEEQFHSQVPEAREDFNVYENPRPDNPFLVEDENENENEDDWDWDALSSTVSSKLTEEKEVPLPGPRAELPTDESEQEEGVTPVEMLMNTTGEHPAGKYFAALDDVLDGFRKHFSSLGGPRTADSSVAPETLPGPRVMHVGPGESPEEFGYFTDQDERPSDDPLGEGFSHLERVEESPVADGTTGYADATQGDETVFKTSASRLAETYSWLPGSDNEKPLNYYELGLSDEDEEWMRAHNQPDPPPGMAPPPSELPTDGLWDAVRG